MNGNQFIKPFAVSASLQGQPNPTYWNPNKCNPSPRRFKNMNQNFNNIQQMNPNSVCSSLTLPPPQPGQQLPSLLNSPMPILSQSFSKINDPITKAVVNNVMGTVRKNTKPKQQYYRCKECNLFLNSQDCLDVHLQGAKHARQLKKLQLSDSTFTCKYILKDGEDNYRCTLCAVVASSLIHIKSHIEGSKHKAKEKKQLESNTAEDSVAECSEPVPKKKQKVDENSEFFCSKCGVSSNSKLQYDQHLTSKKHIEGKTKQAPVVETPKPVPENKQKLEDNSQFFCSSCGVSSNSKLQHDQHMASKKHANKISFPAVNNQAMQKNKQRFKTFVKSTFIPGGTLQYNAWDPQF